MGSKDFWEIASFVVTVIGLPLAIVVFLWEQRRERENDEEEEYQLLADAYNDFLKVVLDNSDEFRWVAVAIGQESRPPQEEIDQLAATPEGEAAAAVETAKVPGGS